MKLDSYAPKWWYDKIVDKELSFNGCRILLLALDDSYDKSEREGDKNLVSVNSDNEIIWIAGLPTEVYDSYCDIWFENGVLLARSSNSHIAEIDPEIGKILKAYMVR